jgi:protein-tyrosine-phosphatase
MAAAFFNRQSGHQGVSAGTQVGDQEDQNLRDRSRVPEASSTPGNMLRIMQEEEGLDLRLNRRKQLTPEMVSEADRVVVMCESDPYPEYLSNDARVTFWNIQDLYGAPYASVRQLKDEIKGQVAQLVREIG